MHLKRLTGSPVQCAHRLPHGLAANNGFPEKVGSVIVVVSVLLWCLSTLPRGTLETSDAFCNAALPTDAPESVRQLWIIVRPTYLYPMGNDFAQGRGVPATNSRRDVW
jgi:hypothetical protein